MIEHLDGALARNNAATRSLEGTLRLGVLSGPAGGPHLVEIINAFESAHPECSVEVVQMSWEDLLGLLREGEVEVIATRVPLKQPDLVVGPTLSRQPRVLAVARDHQLAGRDSVDVEELGDHRVVRFDNWPTELREAVVPSRTPQGRPIRGEAVGVGDRAPLGLPVRVARGDLVLPTVGSAAPYMGELALAVVPLTGIAPLRSALVWRRPARDPRLRAFIHVARQILEN